MDKAVALDTFGEAKRHRRRMKSKDSEKELVFFSS
jgi:hypothetical protein